MSCVSRGNIISESAPSAFFSMVRVPSYPHYLAQTVDFRDDRGYCSVGPTYGLYLHRDIYPVEGSNLLLSFKVTRTPGIFQPRTLNSISDEGYLPFIPVSHLTGSNKREPVIFRLVLGAKIKNRSALAWNDLHFYNHWVLARAETEKWICPGWVPCDNRNPRRGSCPCPLEPKSGDIRPPSTSGWNLSLPSWANYSKRIQDGPREGIRGSSPNWVNCGTTIRDIALYGHHAEFTLDRQVASDSLARMRPESNRIYINPEDVEYYFAEINLSTRDFSIGKQEGSKQIIYKKHSTLIPVVNTTTPSNAYLNAYNLKFTSFIKSNSIELSALLDNKELSIDLPLSSMAHIGSFGVYVFNSVSASNSFDWFFPDTRRMVQGTSGTTQINPAVLGGRDMEVGTRSLNNKYEFCSTNYKTYTIGFKCFSSDVVGQVPGAVAQINQIFESFNIKFIGYAEQISSVPDSTNLFSLADGAADFNFVVRTSNNNCCCGSSSVIDGCAYIANSNSCLGRGWVNSLNSRLLARQIGHSFGARLIYDGSLMDPFGQSNNFSSQSISEISQGINNWCSFKGSGGLPVPPYIPPIPDGEVPTPPDPTPPPNLVENVASLRFERNVPSQVYLFESENISLNTDVTPLNSNNRPVNTITERFLARECRANQGCYIWEKKENNIWKQIQKRIGVAGKVLNIPFSISANESFWEIRCRVLIGSREAISNVCKISRRPTNSVIEVNNYNQVFTYPANLPALPIDTLPEDIKKNIFRIDIVDPRVAMGRRAIWNNPLFPSWYPGTRRIIDGTFQPGARYFIASIPPNLAIRSGVQRPSAAVLPYKIDLLFNSSLTVQSLDQASNNSVNNLFTEEGLELPNYNIDTDWSYDVQDSSGIFILDKQMVVPINDINNINKIDKIYTYRKNKLYLYKSNYDFNNLNKLIPNETYYFVSKDQDTFTLSYSTN